VSNVIRKATAFLLWSATHSRWNKNMVSVVSSVTNDAFSDLLN